MIGLWSLMATAWAFDAHGLTVAPAQGEGTDPLWAWSPWNSAAGSWNTSVTWEYANTLLIRQITEGDSVTTDVPVSAMLGANLSGTYAVSDRWGLALTAPVWVSQRDTSGAVGGGLGTWRAWAPVALRTPAEGGFGLGVVPWVDLPTGSSALYRRAGVGGGALLALGLEGGPFLLRANLGAGVNPANTLRDDTGAIALDHRLQADLSWSLIWDAPSPGQVHLEGYFSPTRGSAPPAEIAVLGSWPTRHGLRALVGASTALSEAPTAARFRVFAGVSFGKYKAPLVPAEPSLDPVAAGPGDLEVRVSDPEGRPLAARVLAEDLPLPAQDTVEGRAVLTLGPGTYRVRVEAEGYGAQEREVLLAADAWGPETLLITLHRARGDAAVEFSAQDAADRPVDQAQVSLNGQGYGDLGNQGVARVEGLRAGNVELGLSAAGFVAGQTQALSASTTSGQARVVLERPPGTVRVTVRGPEGPVPDVRVRLLGPEVMAPLSLDPRGQQYVQLSPGLWTLAASSATHGSQERDLELPDDFTGLMDVEMVLRPAAAGPSATLSLRALDPDGQPVEGVQVLLDGQALGRTSSGGTLRVEGLSPGAHALSAQGERLRPVAVDALELPAGEREVLLTFAWLPGTLQVLARGPEGPVDGVALRFSGPEPLPTAELGPDGEGFFSLAPGEWTVALSAASFGLQEREVLVAPDETSLLVLDAVLQADEAGTANLTVAVTDPKGRPAADVGVLLDGDPVGRTSTGGTVTLSGLDAGPRTVAVDGGALLKPIEQAVELRPGDNTLALNPAFKAGAVNVSTRTADGAVLDALIRLYGSTNIPPTRVGADGQRTFVLDPGEWLVVASSERFGAQEKDVEVKPDQLAEVQLAFTLRSSRADEVLDEPPPRPVRVVVRSADGAPLDAGLRLLGPQRIDGVGTGPDGVYELTLPPAAWEVIASAEGFGARREAVVVPPGQEALELVITLGDEKVEVTREQVKILEQVHFDLNQSTIRPESFAVLDEVANTLILNPQIRRVEIQGHTDNVGTPEYNEALSLARAEAVRAYLVQKGVSARRLEARGYGQRVPLVAGDSEAARAKNRRVQFEILELADGAGGPAAPPQ